MKHRLAVATAVAFLCGLLSVPRAWAAAFIKFEGVEGESQDANHKGWSDLASFSQAMNRSVVDGTGATRSRGVAILEDIVVTKELDKASPKLAEALCKGKVFPKVEIHLTATYSESVRVTYYTYELKNVQVSGYSIAGSGQSEEPPTEQMSISFEEIKVIYTECEADGKKKGNIEYSWKVEEGKL